MSNGLTIDSIQTLTTIKNLIVHWCIIESEALYLLLFFFVSKCWDAWLRLIKTKMQMPRYLKEPNHWKDNSSAQGMARVAVQRAC